MMSSGALLAYIPLVFLAGWSAWHWLFQNRVNWWRLAAALGIVVVAIATVWDLDWHQTHPMEVGASMAALPPHQAILAGFLIGLVGATYGAASLFKGSGSASIDSTSAMSAVSEPHASSTNARRAGSVRSLAPWKTYWIRSHRAASISAPGLSRRKGRASSAIV